MIFQENDFLKPRHPQCLKTNHRRTQYIGEIPKGAQPRRGVYLVFCLGDH